MLPVPNGAIVLREAEYLSRASISETSEPDERFKWRLVAKALSLVLADSEIVPRVPPNVIAALEEAVGSGTAPALSSSVGAPVLHALGLSRELCRQIRAGRFDIESSSAARRMHVALAAITQWHVAIGAARISTESDTVPA